MGFLSALGSALGSASGVSSIIDAGSNLISNLFNKSSTNKTNETNMRIAQMNNEWSEKMMQKQMDYNTEMWNKQNEYNDPSKQVERLEAAGINPALALSNISTGSAQGASSPSLPSPSGATMQPTRYDFSGIGAAVRSAYELQNQTDLINAQINNLNAQSDVSRARAAADNAWTYERLKETKVGRMFLEQTFDVRKNQMNADYQNSLRQGRQMEENIKLSISQGLLAQKELAIFDAQRAAGIANTIADTMLKCAQRKLTHQQMIHEVQKIVETSARAQGLKISNNIAKRTADSLVKKAYYESRPANNVWQLLSGIPSDIGYSFFGKGR